MKKKSWSWAASVTKSPLTKKRLKKQRSKGRRRSNDMAGFEKSTGAWDLA